MKQHADLLVVTVTKLETQSVLEAFEAQTGKPASVMAIGHNTYHSLGTINGTLSFLVQSEMGASGVGASLMTLQGAITDLRPCAVIMVRISFGIDVTKQEIGDILVSKQLLLHELQRVGTADSLRLNILPRGDRPHCSEWLLKRFRAAELTWKGATARFGLVLSGEKLVIILTSETNSGRWSLRVSEEKWRGLAFTLRANMHRWSGF